MQKFIIDGGIRLSGTVNVSGSKNEVLPTICAALLTSDRVVIKNAPLLSDTKNMIDIISRLGAKAELKGRDIIIEAKKLNSHTPDVKMVRKMRGSVLLMGALLGRLGKADVAYPGGDVIGPRPVSVHIKAFKSMGIRVREVKDGVRLSGRPHSAQVLLSEISVTATENALMAAVLSSGTTELRLSATEPHVENLSRMLVSMGAKISGIGTHNIKITGVKKLHGTTHTIIPDQLESATFAILGALTKSRIKINGFVFEHNEMLLNKFDEMGVKYKKLSPRIIQILPATKLKPAKIRTDIYPGFPTDYQAPFAVLLTQADGESEIFETMYEGRLNYVYELQKMGANVKLEDNHTVKISGPTELTGTEITTFDIRAGATLVLAALAAKGQSVIYDIEHLDRGYEKIDEKLRKIGAKIYRQPV